MPDTKLDTKSAPKRDAAAKAAQKLVENDPVWHNMAANNFLTTEKCAAHRPCPPSAQVGGQQTCLPRTLSHHSAHRVRRRRLGAVRMVLWFPLQQLRHAPASFPLAELPERGRL